MLTADDPQILKLAARAAEFITTPADLATAEACLDEAWEWVRVHGKLEWDYADPSTPTIAKTIALTCAARCYANPSGFISERGDAVAFERYEDFSKGAEPTRAEVAALHKMADKRSSIQSISVENPNVYRSRQRNGRQRSYLIPNVQVGDPDRRRINLYGWEM